MSVLIEECLRQLRYHLSDLSRQPNIPLDYSPPPKKTFAGKGGGVEYSHTSTTIFLPQEEKGNGLVYIPSIFFCIEHIPT